MTAVNYRTADVEGFHIFYREAGTADGNRGKFPGDGGSHSLESVIQALNDTAAA
jgi:hypothetical protein